MVLTINDLLKFYYQLSIRIFRNPSFSLSLLFGTRGRMDQIIHFLINYEIKGLKTTQELHLYETMLGEAFSSIVGNPFKERFLKDGAGKKYDGLTNWFGPVNWRIHWVLQERRFSFIFLRVVGPPLSD